MSSKTDPNFAVLGSRVRTSFYFLVKQEADKLGFSVSKYVKEAVIEKMNRG
jgi:hypothetical protein